LQLGYKIKFEYKIVKKKYFISDTTRNSDRMSDY
jgi:hypothetical protein